MSRHGNNVEVVISQVSVHQVEVIDVRKQASLRMALSEFVDYFETPPEHRDDKVLNVLSLEFSDTK